MKIAIIADPLDKQNAGIHYYTKWMINALISEDSDNIFYVIRNGKTPVSKKFVHVNVPTISFPGFLTFRKFFIIPRLIKKHNIDVVVEPAHYGPYNLPRNVKRITIVHDLSVKITPQFHRFLSFIYFMLFFRMGLKRTDLIIANSENTSKDIKEYFPVVANKIKVIYPAVEKLENKLQPSNKVLNLIDKPYLLYLGTIEPRKNLITLLDAYSDFRDKHDNIRLIIAGAKGWRTNKIFSNLNNHKYKDDIIISGYLSEIDKIEIYRNAMAFIYPSFYEGFGLPVLEAMSLGIPCIVSETSSLTEVGGDAVLYFNPESSNELNEKIIKVVSDEKLRNELSEKGLIQSRKFSWDKFAKEFLNEIKKL